MSNMPFGKIAAGAAGIAVVGLVVAFASGVFNTQFSDGGVDVRRTACEDIAAARIAVNNELESRRTAAQTRLDAAMEKASDDFWTQNRALEDAHHACMSGALTADPCKPAFEEVGRLYEEIMADFNAGKGFNEAKFQEREQAKKEYDDCVQRGRNDEFYKADTAKCDADLAAGQAANQQVRQAAEAAAQADYHAAIETAQNAHQQKHAILDAIEEKCNEPGGNTNISIGSITTGSTGTEIKASSSACTGVFEGNDPELRKTLNDLENNLQKARAAGLSGGLYGTDHLQQAVDDARQRLRESQRSCTTDADCGDPEPVCCSGTSVGRVFCSNGVCANEVTECEDPEICAGKPAQCVNPTTGAQSQPIIIERTIPEAGSCSQNLRVLNLQQSSAESVRYEITGNIPSWVHIDRPGGLLPANVNVTYSCNTVQGFGPGTYTVNGTITVYNAANELINTIPLQILITVTPVEQEEEMISVIQYNGKYITTDQLHTFTGPECDEEEHWHPNSGMVTATDGTTFADPNPTDCGFGKTKDVPVMQIPASMMQIRVEGLEGLR